MVEPQLVAALQAEAYSRVMKQPFADIHQIAMNALPGPAHDKDNLLQQSIYLRQFKDGAREAATLLKKYLTTSLPKNERISLRPQRDNATAKGLNMLVDRIARLMNDQHIERVETLGETFDGETMNTIDALPSELQSPGKVVEQLAPGYRYRGRVIKYAQVRNQQTNRNFTS